MYAGIHRYSHIAAAEQTAHASLPAITSRGAAGLVKKFGYRMGLGGALMQVGRKFEKDRDQGEIHRQMARFTLERTTDQRDQEWFIERTGAEALNFRIAQQENWEQAEAVRDGRQPRIDPDGIELQEIDEGLRTYRSHEVGGTMDSRPAILTQRLVKRLANGLWESEVEVVNYRYARRPFSGR